MRQNEDRPQDPNHETVVVISSDDEFGHNSGGDEYGEDENVSQEERSSYFQVAPEVDEFNARRRFSHLQRSKFFS